MLVKITKVSATDKKKDGSTIINKFGKTSWRVGIKTNEHGEKWINGFLSFNPTNWEGTEQDVEIYEEEYNGEKKLAFRLPKKSDVSDLVLTEVRAIKDQIATIAPWIKVIYDHIERNTTSDGGPIPFEDEDSPFN